MLIVTRALRPAKQMFNLQNKTGLCVNRMLFLRLPSFVTFISTVLCAIVSVRTAADSPRLATLQEVLSSKQDLWGLAALSQRNGASYEFFAGLLPPLRYVNASFRHYPIVLGAPDGLIKARLISNGSAINARANLNTWRDPGVPVSFWVGSEPRPFGEKVDALDGPRYERGSLPIDPFTRAAAFLMHP